MRGKRRERRSMMAETKLAASGAVLPIRTSPAVGSERNSMSLTPCRNSSKAAWLRLSMARPYSVSSTPRGFRSRSRTPRVCSRSLIERETTGWETASCVRRLCHAPELRHRKQNVQVAQLDATPDPIVPAHASPLAKLLTRCRIIVLFSYERKRARSQPGNVLARAWRQT